MEENKEEKISINTEELKSETIETAKKIKESVKGTNIKEEVKTTKEIFIDILKNPLEKLKEIADDKDANFFKTSIYLIILWTILIFINSNYKIIYYLGFSKIFSNILSVAKSIIAPAIGIIIYSLIVMVINKDNKKSLATTISTITITKLPIIFASLVSLLKIISVNVSIITAPFTLLCEIVSIILSYFAIKYLFGNKKDEIIIKKFVIIQAIYYVAYIVIGLLGIYI